MKIEAPPKSSSETVHRRRRQTSHIGVFGKLWKGMVSVWKYLFGAVLCQNPVLSVLVIGWTYRLVQGHVLKQWWKQSALAHQGSSFSQFAGDSERTQGHTHWPNWLVGQRFLTTLRGGARGSHPPVGRLRFSFRLLVGSLASNIRIGAQGIFNTWVLTLPGCALWVFSWFAGWNNSFHKGYELAFVGPVSGLLGVALFIGAMLYVPLGQARQAATGEWRTFYQFRFVRSLLRHCWFSNLVLAGSYALLFIPVTLAFSLPQFFGQIWPDLQSASDAEARQFLESYYFYVALFGFPAFVALRLLAGRVYASAVLTALKSRTVQPEDLATVEKEALQRLDLLESAAPTPSHLLIRAVGWTSSRVARFAALAVVVFLWFTVVAQVYVGEFLVYHPYVGFLNLPLVQLPWFSWIP